MPENVDFLASFTLLFDQEKEAFVKETLLPLLTGVQKSPIPFKPTETASQLAEKDTLLVYLSDKQLKEILPVIIEKNISIAILPHPQGLSACTSLGIEHNLSNAVSFFKTNPEPIVTDILYANEIPVFESLVVGHTFELTSEASPVKNKVGKSIFYKFSRFFSIKPFRVDVHLPKEKVIKTAVTGLIVSEHRKSSLISRLVLENSSFKDGMMHAFLISPRSVGALFRFALTSYFGEKRLPSFGGHIKTAAIRLYFPEGSRDILLDKEKINTQEIDLKVSDKQITAIPGKYLDASDTNGESKQEVFRVASLPLGDAALALTAKPIPLIRHATADEFKDLFQILRENARLKNTYLVLMVLSTMLATFGLFADSSPVVIGAMILAPLMSPIISLSMGALRQDKNLILDSLATIGIGLAVSAVFAVGLTLLTPIYSPGAEILARTRPNLLDMGIAVVSGIAGAYAHAREEVAKTLAGVAIAVALVPPLAVASIGLGWGNWEIFSGAMLLLTTNLGGIVLSASATFMFLGFSSFKLAKKGILISFLVVLMLSVPLAFGFRHMIEEHTVIRKLEGLKTEIATIKNVKVERLSPLKISVKLVAENTLNDTKINLIKELIESELGTEVELEVLTAVTR